MGFTSLRSRAGNRRLEDLARAAICAGLVAASMVLHAANTPNTPNRLISEKSPYLLEHAHDLVDWYPWGPAAFERAEREHKLIFLSIGYSACHWCHVMQHDDFEDADVAGLINQDFIPVLVDREERPEIDRQYMAACELLTGSGGWPLNLILTPDRHPVFAAVYLPKRSGGGHIGMLELLPKIERQWENNPQSLAKTAQKLDAEVVRAFSTDESGGSLDESSPKKGFEHLSALFDSRFGGFGGAPKFPPYLDLAFLLRYWKRTGSLHALDMVEKTLEAMRDGGIYDQVGLGFHRYSTDAEWRVPHFEKMLYDQAQAAATYAEAYQATGRQQYAATAKEILTYVSRDLTSPQGAFFASQDADSAGEEGRFYLWTAQQIRDAVGAADSKLAIRAFGLSEKGNTPAAGPGENVLYLKTSVDQLAAATGSSPQQLAARLEAVRSKLFDAREGRVDPAVDRKIIAAWNGLAMSAFAIAATALNEPQDAAAAQRAADFIVQNMTQADGPGGRRLLHSYAGGRAELAGDLEDYAFVIQGLLDLYEANFDVKNLQDAIALNEELQRHFEDAKRGGFFDTADDDPEHLLTRAKSCDEADLPSGNAIAALNLMRLSAMTGDSALASSAAAAEKACAGAVQKSPADHTTMLAAAEFALGPSYEVVVAGGAHAPDTRAMLHALQSAYLPDKVVLLRPTGPPAPPIVHLADYTLDQNALDGKATAYVCVKFACKLPTTDVEKMLELVGAKTSAATGR
jgi:uncharacterized protein